MAVAVGRAFLRIRLSESSHKFLTVQRLGDFLRFSLTALPLNFIRILEFFTLIP